MDAVIPAAIIVGLTLAAVGAAYLWITDRDEKRAGYLPKPSEPPSNCTIFVGPWPPRVVPDDDKAS